jgi:hypothetical protein
MARLLYFFSCNPWPSIAHEEVIQRLSQRGMGKDAVAKRVKRGQIFILTLASEAKSFWFCS